MTDKTTELVARLRNESGASTKGVNERVALMDEAADALEAEVQHREEWAATGADRWAKYYQDQIDKAEAERDALRAAVREAIPFAETDDLRCILSRAIDTKEESNE